MIGAIATTAPTSVLIVDDERDNRELLEIILTHRGFSVATAASGPEAIASVALHAPDVVLLDLMMPGMNGYQVAAVLTASDPTHRTAVIIVSALGGSDVRLLALKAGAEDLFTKPMDSTELCERLRAHLAARALLA
jgi:CheY-like chemotaxis protein